MIVEPVFVDTEAVDTVNDAWLVPEATVIEAGTVALGELEASVIVTPPCPAGVKSVMAAEEICPPVTVVGDSLRVNGIGMTVSVWLADCPPAVALMTVVAVDPTAKVVMGNVAEVAPAGTTTKPDGNPAAWLLEFV